MRPRSVLGLGLAKSPIITHILLPGHICIVHLCLQLYNLFVGSGCPVWVRREPTRSRTSPFVTASNLRFLYDSLIDLTILNYRLPSTVGLGLSQVGYASERRALPAIASLLNYLNI